MFKGNQWLYKFCVSERFLYLCPSVLYLSQKHTPEEIFHYADKALDKGYEHEYSIGREQYLATDPLFIMLHSNEKFMQRAQSVKPAMKAL